MENRKGFEINGIYYNVLTDEEIEEIKLLAILEEKDMLYRQGNLEMERITSIEDILRD